MHTIFISYSSHDCEQAKSLAVSLRSAGYDTWMDDGGISGAMDWSSEIVNAINDCSTMLFLISQNSAASHNCAKELRLASEKNKNILPIILDNTQLPVIFEYPLAGLQRVRYNDTDTILKTLSKLKSGSNALDAMVTMSKESSDTRIRIAILPFDDLSPEHDHGWFADGMMDELIGTLGSLKKLRVSSRSDVMYYKQNRPKAKEIADDLEVRYLVEGSVRKIGEKIRISASLTDTAEHSQIWSNNYNGTFGDIFDFQEQVAKQIAETLKLKLTPEEEKKVEKKPTENAEAYELYLKGVMYYNRSNKSDYDRAFAVIQEAIRLDPDFALAYSQLALTCHAIYLSYPKIEWLDRADAATKKVFEIEGETAMYFRVASALALRRNDGENALRLAQCCIKADPDYAAGYDILSNAYHHLGKLAEAAKASEQLVRLRENNVSAHFFYLIMLDELADKEHLLPAAQKAIPIHERHIRLNPEDYNTQVNFAFVLYWADRKPEAIKTAETVAKIESLSGMALSNLAGFYLICEIPDRGIEMLRRSVADGYKHINLLAPEFDSIRGTKEFEEIAEKLTEP